MLSDEAMSRTFYDEFKSDIPIKHEVILERPPLFEDDGTPRTEEITKEANKDVHEYFGKQYFGKKELSEEEYDQSKKITFRLLYGGIDDDFAKIPFFKKTRSFIRTLWSNFKENGFVVTPLMKRPLYKNCLHDMNPNKLFNDLLSEYNTNIILYTYDSLLFDYDMSDGKELLNKLKDVMNQAGRFPVKIKAGVNYHAMTDMTSRIA